MPADDGELPVLDGPDPRDWHRDKSIVELEMDIKTIDVMWELLAGRQDMAMGRPTPLVQQALGMLADAATGRREDLALLMMAKFGLEPTEEAAASPFTGAGRPRAFGAEPSPPPGTLCPD